MTLQEEPQFPPPLNGDNKTLPNDLTGWLWGSEVTTIGVSVQLGGSPRESSSLSLNQVYLVLTCTDLFVAGGVLSTLLRREGDMSKG